MKKIIIFIMCILMTSTTLVVTKEQSSGSWEEVINVKVAQETDTRARIVIETTGEVKFHVFRVSNPSRLVVEMVDTVLNWSRKEIEIGGNLVKRVRSGQYKNKPVKIVRVVLDMKTEEYYYEEVSTKNQITISVSLSDEEAKKIEKNQEKKEQKKAAKNKTYSQNKYDIKPNVPTEKHSQEIAKIKQQKSQRIKQKKKRLEKLKEMGVADDEDSVLLESLSSDPVNFNFKQADIKEVLKSFAMRLDKNIVPSPNVSGKVTLRLKQVPFDQAFEMLLDRMNLVAIQKTSNVIQVMKRDEMPTERKTYKLINRNAKEVQNTLDGLLTSEEKKNTTIYVDEASNSLIVTATPRVLKKIRLMRNQLDIKAPQIKIKARLIEVQAGEDFSSNVTWINKVDFEEGEDIDYIRGVKDVSNYTFDDSGNVETEEAITVFGTGLSLDISAVMNNMTLYSVLNFLASETEARTVSEPTILTENNKSAKIHVGRNLPVRTTQVTETGTTQSVEFIPEGVDLQVTPVVSPGSSQISLKVNVSVSEFVGFQADNPITTERSAQTEVTVESGKTIVIGGLIKERISQTNTGVPILKDIPLIGYLFSNKTKSKTKNELLVFLSPEILIE
ncbi:MAG: AMIN domain-containing protein [Elusimicrobiota bacterium]